MGKMNLLKANWVGKVGQTVGAKWKNQSTIRTYAKPANPKTADQQRVRGVFAQMTAYIALFSDQIKYVSSLPTRSMSVRNAIIQANKEQVAAGNFTKADLVINKGGLPTVSGATVAYASGNVTITYTAPVATNISDKAKIVGVVVDEANNRAWASTDNLADGELTIAVGTLAADISLDVYYYIIDYRGSSKVGSVSTYATTTTA